jgi:phage FluMu protein Com
MRNHDFTLINLSGRKPRQDGVFHEAVLEYRCGKCGLMVSGQYTLQKCYSVNDNGDRNDAPRPQVHEHDWDLNDEEPILKKDCYENNIVFLAYLKYQCPRCPWTPQYEYRLVSGGAATLQPGDFCGSKGL